MSIDFEQEVSPDERRDWERYGVRAEKLPADPRVRERLLRNARGGEHIPRWQKISGLYFELDATYNGEDRRKRVRRIVHTAQWLMRKELKLHEQDPKKDERSIYWDPLHEVCRQLQIARSKLSSFCKELTGLSASQMVDSIKAERVTVHMRTALCAFLQSELTAQHGDTEARSKDKGGKALDRWEVWKKLKATRRQPEFSYATWALDNGFSSYTRFFRACLAVHRRTPHQLEMEIIDDLLREAAGEPSPDKRARPEQTLEEIETRAQELMPRELLMDPWKAVERNE